MDLGKAVKRHPEGCTIRFDVVPGSSLLAVPSGFNPWREALEAKLSEKPQNGKANRQMVAEVAKALDIPEANIKVISGHKIGKKILLAKGVTVDQAVSILSQKIK